MKLHLPKSPSKTVLILGGLFGALVGAFWIACHFLIDADAFKNGLLKAITDQSGYAAQARDAELGIFPLPHVIVSDLSVQNAPEAANSYIFNVREATFRLDIVALLKGHAVPADILLNGPDLELERFTPTETNWQAFFRKQLALEDSSLRRITVQSGAIVYSNGVDASDEFKNIDFVLYLGKDGKFDLSGNATAYDRQGQFAVESSGGHFSSPDDFQLDLKSHLAFGRETLDYKGVFGKSSEQGQQIKGHLDLAADNVSDWMTRLMKDSAKQGAFDALPKNLPLTLSMTVDEAQRHGKLTIEKLTLGDSRGSAAFTWDAGPAPKKASGSIAFETLDFDQMLTGENKEENAVNALFAFILPADVDGEFTAKADSLTYGRATFSKVDATASLSGGEMVINRAAAMLPGATRVFTFGILKRDPTGRVNYDGTSELLGEDVLAFMNGIGLEQANIIPATKQKFRAKADLFLAPHQGTISGLRFQAGDFQFSGGVNFNQGGKYDVGMTLLFKHAKLDPIFGFFAPVSRGERAQTFEKLDRKLPWLKDVEKKYSLNLLFQDFTIGSQAGSLTQISAIVQKDRIDVDKIDMHLDDIGVAGSFGFHQDAEIPEIDVSLNLTRFNLTSLLAEDLVKHPVPRDNNRNVWNTSKFNFDYLRGYSGKFELHIDQALHPDFSISDLSISATADNGDWNISNLTGNIWGGQLKSAGHLQALTVPALSSQFYLTNVQAEQMFNSVAGFQALRGNTSISGEFSTSGVTAEDWARNMNGAMAFRGDQFAIRGFDLAGLVQTIPSVRSVADVVNTARIATLRGQSTFILVEGSFYVQQGVLATKGITFRSRQSIGNFEGSIDLMHWLMDSGIEFKLITVATQDYPVVKLTFQNSMDNPVIGLDTRSLEAFVARRKLE